jgi:hypothetical protein
MIRYANERDAMIRYAAAAVLAVAVFAPSARAAQPARSVEGNWQGTLKVGAIELRLVIKVAKAGDGKLTGKMDSIDQGAKDIPLDEVTLKDDVFRFEFKAGRLVYEGKLGKDGTTITGTLTQVGMKFPLELKKVDKVAELVRPQMPKKPYPYREEEVTYENKPAGVKLAGTLTLPPGTGPFPAVLLISGSGPQDRDETLMGHKPFLVLADHLTRRGIAVLRVDDRGVGKSTGKFGEATSLDFASDARAGVEFLKSRAEINPKQIGLMGHSEGGMIAPLVATQTDDVAFIVLLAGTGLPGDEVLIGQGQAILKALGADAKALARQKSLQEKIFAVVRSETDPAAAEQKLKKLADELTASLTPEEKKELDKIGGTLAAQLEGQFKMVTTPWFRYFLGYDPRATLRKVKCPVLAINGEKDLQVLPKENLAAIEKALREGGNSHVTVKEFPGLNHLFQTCTTGAPTEYGKIEETFAPAALEFIADWIRKQTGIEK